MAEEETGRKIEIEGEQSEEREEPEADVRSGGEEESPVSDQETETLESKCKELNDKYLRLYAEFDNYRKKILKEKEELLRYGSEPLMYELLTVLDTLEIGLQHADDDSDNSVRTGVQMTLKEFLRVLEKFGVKRVTALMQPFDPAYHEAMTQVVDNEVDEGTVVQEFRKGYMFHDKLLRPALVAVSKTGPEEGESEELSEN